MTARLPLVGREAELAELRGLAAEAADGRGRIVLVEGEAGIGKTRLLDELLMDAANADVQVFRAAAEELERNRPFGAITDALEIGPASIDPGRVGIAQLLYPNASDSLPLAEGGTTEFRAVEAILTFIEDRCARMPVTIALEDLHWADPSTFPLLNRLGRAAADLPLFLVCTFRPVPRPRDLDTLTERFLSRQARHLVLAPLDGEAVSSMVASLVGGNPGPRLRRQMAATAGNPLFIRELVGAFQDEDALECTEGLQVDVKEERPEGIPSSVAGTILRRLSFLPERTVLVLQVAAVVGARFETSNLALALKKPLIEVLQDLQTAVRAGILGEESDLLTFRHDLIREALYGSLPAPVRINLHLELGRALAEAGAPAQEVAKHMVRGASPGDLDAVKWLADAARDVAVRAPAVAVDLFERAIQLTDSAGAGRDALLAELATSLQWSGRVAEAEAVCREVLSRRHDPGQEGRFRSCLAYVLLAEGRSAEALREVETAMSSPALTEEERALVEAWGSHARILAGDLDGAMQAARRVRAVAERLGATLPACIAIAALAMKSQFSGDPRAALELIDEAIRLADQSSGREGHQFHLGVARAFILLDLDRPNEAVKAIQHGRQISEEIGAKWTLPMYQIALIAARFQAGEWDDAVAEYEVSLDLAEEIGTRHGMIFNNSVRSLIALHRNDLKGAETFCAAAEREFAETGPQFRADWMMWARALLLDATGNTAAAWAALAGAWDRCEAAGLTSEFAVLGPDLVRLSLAGRDGRRAERVCLALDKLGLRTDTAGLSATALRCHGLLESRSDLLLAAVDSYRKSARPLDLALACEDAAASLLAEDKLDFARALLDEALQIYDHLDATRDAARAASYLHVRGLRRGRPGPRRRPRSGWESLTPTEVRVASLTADGLSNPRIAERLFISRLTVRTHLSHIFAKLGISSRVELATATLSHSRRH